MTLSSSSMDFRRAFPLTRISPVRNFSWMVCRLAVAHGLHMNGRSLRRCVQGSMKLQPGFPRPSCRCSVMCRSWMKISRTSAGSGSSRVSTATRPSRESSDQMRLCAEVYLPSFSGTEYASYSCDVISVTRYRKIFSSFHPLSWIFLSIRSLVSSGLSS